MEYRLGDFCHLPNHNPQKLPFYMTYPMQNVFLEEAEYAQDLNRLKSMYPQEVRKIQKAVEEECDKMEYEGSLMFDEYPDRMMLLQIVWKIYLAVTPEEARMESMEYVDSQIGDFSYGEGETEGYVSENQTKEALLSEELHAMAGRRRPVPRPPHHHRRCRGRECSLIEILLLNEISHRRCRHKRCRRWW